jgi:hypothetical protein
VSEAARLAGARGGVVSFPIAGAFFFFFFVLRVSGGWPGLCRKSCYSL